MNTKEDMTMGKTLKKAANIIKDFAEVNHKLKEDVYGYKYLNEVAENNLSKLMNHCELVDKENVNLYEEIDQLNVHNNNINIEMGKLKEKLDKKQEEILNQFENSNVKNSLSLWSRIGSELSDERKKELNKKYSRNNFQKYAIKTSMMSEAFNKRIVERKNGLFSKKK